MEEANVAIIKDTLMDVIKKKAIAHSEQYIERYKKVAYDSYLAGMEAMSEIMGGK